MEILKDRSEIEDKYKWRLEDIYENENLWEEDYSKTKELLEEVLKFKGKINTSRDLLEVLKLNDQIGMTASKIFAYARMRRDEDNTNPKYQALTDKAMRLNIEVMSATSFIAPEILSIDTQKLMEMIEELEELKIYKQYLEDLIRFKPHVLSPEEEKILAEAKTLAESVSNIYTMLNNADMRFPTIKDEEGKEVELTHGNFIALCRVKIETLEKLHLTPCMTHTKNL